MKQLTASAFEHAPAGMDEVFQLGRRWVMPLLRPMLPVRRLHGLDGSGRPATILAVGTQMTLDALVARFFAATPAREELGQVPLPCLRDSLRHRRRAAELVLAVVPRAYAGWLGRDHLHVPALVGFELRVGRTIAMTLAQANSTIRHDARQVPEVGYSWTTSTEMADFERFFAQFYRPFARARFGPLAVVREPSVLRRHFRHGGAIVWVHRDGRAVGGELVRRQGSSLERLVQALDGDWAGPRNEPSPQLAIGVACLELAVGAGLDRIGFGGAVPSLRDGVLRVKRAWGASAHHWDANHRTLLIGWSEFGRVPRSFLHLNPLIFGAAGGLAAVAATAPGEPADLAAARLIWRRLIPRGIGRLFLVGAAGWSSHAPDGGTAAGGPIVLCPPCSSAELVAAATAPV